MIKKLSRGPNPKQSLLALPFPPILSPIPLELQNRESSISYSNQNLKEIGTAEIMSVSVSHEPAATVPPILSPSKQQNRESLIFKPIHGGKEIWTPVLLLPSQIFPSIAEGNIVLCKNEGSLSAENPERKSPALSIGSKKELGKCHPDTINRPGWHFIFFI